MGRRIDLLRSVSAGAFARSDAPFRRWAETRIPTFAPAVFLGGRVARATPRAGAVAFLFAWRRLRASPLTLLFTALNLGIYLVAEHVGGQRKVEDFVNALAVDHIPVLSGEWWRLLTANWAHANWHHVEVNSEYLLAFGVLLEPAIGSAAFAGVYGVSSLFAGIFSLTFGYGRAVGASGAVFGINAALLVCAAFPKRVSSILVWTWAAFEAGTGLTAQHAFPLGFPAHAGGFMGGLFAGAFVAPRFSWWWSSRRRLLAASLASVALVGALSLDPQWRVKWQGNAARVEANAGRTDAAYCRWEEIERIADADNPNEAEVLAGAAMFHREHDRPTRARALMSEVAPTLEDADAYCVLGEMQSDETPCDDVAALANFSRALALDPRSARALSDAAWLRLWTSDSTLFDPCEGLRLALCALREDGGSSHSLYVLSWAQFAHGRRSQAVRSLRRAFDLDPSDREVRRAWKEMTMSCAPWRTMADRDRWDAAADVF